MMNLSASVVNVVVVGEVTSVLHSHQDSINLHLFAVQKFIKINCEPMK